MSISISQEANPNYLAKIIKVTNLQKHPNADKLQMCLVDFQNVITGMDTKEGDVCVFFPLESAINVNFLAATNSFRDKEMNRDKDQAGFFESKGRVRAVKLRGEKSMGYIVPVETIESFVGYKISDHVGEEFDMIGDILMVKKYFVPSKNIQRIREGQKPRISRLIDGQVHLHVDTENLRKNVTNINPEDQISITYKMHGCLPGDQKVKMYNGKTVPIRDIQIGDIVLGYDHKKNRFVPSIVINSGITGRAEEWFTINKTCNKNDLGGVQERLVCTGNHRVFCVNRHKYIEAKNLKVGDKIISNVKKEFTPVIEAITSITSRDARGNKSKYDIETETHNFVSGGMLIHNSSGWCSNVLVKSDVGFVERCIRRIFILGDKVEHDFVFGSRKVVKNGDMQEGRKLQHFYDVDIWGIAKDELKEFIPKGYTFYFEIVGYTPSGAAIQSQYDYGCVQGEHKSYIYRITFTNADGVVRDLSTDEIREWASKMGFNYVPHFYTGKAKDLFPELDVENHWHEEFMKKLEATYNGKNCFMCRNVVPEEGIVLRKESGFQFESYKLKSYEFLEYETKLLDEGVENIEDQIA